MFLQLDRQAPHSAAALRPISDEQAIAAPNLEDSNAAR